MCCELEIDVNGQGTFFVDKKILACYSGRLRKMFRMSQEMSGKIKLIFHDFPGGPVGFELIAQFCYKGAKMDITPSNVIFLYFAATFMEIDEDSSGAFGLIHQTGEYIKGIHQFAWLDLLECLKQLQDLHEVACSSHMVQEFLDCVVGRLSPCAVFSPYDSSTDSSCTQFSGDISRESISISNCSSQTTTWWFESLEFLKIDLLEKLVLTMISKQLDQYTISSFLLHYQRMKFGGTNLLAVKAEKRRITETLINLLCLLDRSLISPRGLLETLGLSLSLKLNRCSKEKLENLVGSILDRAKLDDLLFPSPPGKSYAYDVDLIVRLQKQFLLECNAKQYFLMYRLKKVAVLMDSYITEVAPDPNLKPSKFLALATALPDIARDSHDKLYQALDLYFKVHHKLRIEVKMKICCILDRDKLSAGVVVDLAHNINFQLVHRKLDCQRNDQRSRTHRAVDEVKGEKQTRAGRITELSTISPNNSKAFPGLSL